MTFCVGIHVEEGIVALSDTQIIRGGQVAKKAKLSTLDSGGHETVVMTSGLRSVRDKVVARLEDRLGERPEPHQRLHELATSFGEQLRDVRAEDEGSLIEGGLTFNTHAILGGRLRGDGQPELIMVYPEGNWVAATPDAPSHIIGRTYYGKPILDRLLRFDTPLHTAVSLAYLAFDATRESVNDVDFPIDVAILAHDESRFVRRRYTTDELAPVHAWWHQQLRAALDGLPTAWAADLFQPTEEAS